MRRDFPQPGELAPFHSIKRNLESGRYKGYYLRAGCGVRVGSGMREDSGKSIGPGVFTGSGVRIDSSVYINNGMRKNSCAHTDTVLKHAGSGVEVGYMVLTISEGAGPVYGNYFAVHPELRSKGYGRAFLGAIVKKYRDRPIIIEVSDPAASKNTEQRDIDKKRVRFYESAGFTIASTSRCRIYGADMLVMATNLYNGFNAREAIFSLYDHPSAAENIDIVDA